MTDSQTQREPVPEQRLSQLDGLRAIAVGGVVVQHGLGLVGLSAKSDGFALGSVGVRLFFVLSGFLITGILLNARNTAAACSASRWKVWSAFYCRRAVRILPLAYFVLALAWLAGSPTARAHPWMYNTYTSNYFAANIGFTDPSLDHFWSLAIEEQFYLIWPVVLLAAPTRWLAVSMAAIAGLSMVARAAILAQYGVHPAYVLTPSRLDALAIGGLLAWYQIRWPDMTMKVVVALTCAGVCARMASRFWPSSAFAMALPETGYVLLSAAVVLWTARGIGGFTGRALSARPIVFIGTISYGIYVYHMAIAGLAPIVAARFHLPNPFPAHDGWQRLCWMTATTLPVATASWYLFEKPFNNLKYRFPYVRRVRGVEQRPAAVSVRISEDHPPLHVRR